MVFPPVAVAEATVGHAHCVEYAEAVVFLRGTEPSVGDVRVLAVLVKATGADCFIDLDFFGLDFVIGKAELPCLVFRVNCPRPKGRELVRLPVFPEGG